MRFIAAAALVCAAALKLASLDAPTVLPPMVRITASVVELLVAALLAFRRSARVGAAALIVLGLASALWGILAVGRIGYSHSVCGCLGTIHLAKGQMLAIAGALVAVGGVLLQRTSLAQFTPERTET